MLSIDHFRMLSWRLETALLLPQAENSLPYNWQFSITIHLYFLTFVFANRHLHTSNFLSFVTILMSQLIVFPSTNARNRKPKVLKALKILRVLKVLKVLTFLNFWKFWKFWKFRKFWKFWSVDFPVVLSFENHCSRPQQYKVRTSTNSMVLSAVKGVRAPSPFPLPPPW